MRGKHCTKVFCRTIITIPLAWVLLMRFRKYFDPRYVQVYYTTISDGQPKRGIIADHLPPEPNMYEAKSMARDIWRNHFLGYECTFHFIQVTREHNWKRKPAELKCEEIFRIKVVNNYASLLTPPRRTAPCSYFWRGTFD